MIPLLKELKIEVTHKCPLACIHCSSDGLITNPDEMSCTDCQRIISEASDLGVNDISFSGGEPLIWEGIISCVKTAFARGIKSSIYTSGNIDSFNDIAFELSKYELKRFIFSIYSDDEIEHDRVTRKRGSFLKTFKAIKLSHSNGIPVEVHFVAMRNNYKKLSNLVKLCIQNSIDTLSILRFVPQGRGRFLDSAIMNIAQYKELRKDILMNRKKRINLRIGSPLNFLMINDNLECLSAIDRLIIGPKMEIFPCDAFKQFCANHFVYDEYSNLEKHSLIECWEKSEYLKLIRNKINDYCMTCKECSSFIKCKSGCLAQKNAVYGKLCNSPDPSCLMGNGK